MGDGGNVNGSDVPTGGKKAHDGGEKRRKVPHLYMPILAVTFGIGLAISIVVGPPSTMPGVALGSTMLLHVERAVTLLAAVLLIAVILDQAWDGELPSEISGKGVKYEKLRQNSEALSGITAKSLKGLHKAVAEERAQREELEEKVTALEAQQGQV